ncbi:MAG: hypothetical protein ACYC7F_11030, partial [Gemmatimonadaceae bacterium]
GFLFGPPKTTLALRLGYAMPSAGSDLFSFVTDELSLRRRDFGSMAFGADFALALNARLSAVISMDFGGMDKKSDYREWQDNSGNPIEQSTSFERRAFTAGLRYYLRPYGRQLSRYAWIPSRLAPWVSAGVGRTHYKFAQHGDFVDFTHSNRVFTDWFSSSAWGATAQVSAGADWSLRPRLAMTTQAKYVRGKADLGLDYSGFAPIDLSGLSMSTGLAIRF